MKVVYVYIHIYIYIYICMYTSKICIYTYFVYIYILYIMLENSNDLGVLPSPGNHGVIGKSCPFMVLIPGSELIQFSRMMGLT